MMKKYKLWYFNSRGKCEPIRQMFAYGGIDFEDIRYAQDDWPNHKCEMPFGKMPVLEVDGHKISQAAGIQRFVAKKVGLYSDDDMECAMIDMVLDTCDELYQFMIPKFFYEKDPVKKADVMKTFEDEFMPTFLDNFDKNFGEGEYLVGERMTVADIRFVSDIKFIQGIGSNITLDKHPKLKALQEKVDSHPKIAHWNSKRPVTQF